MVKIEKVRIQNFRCIADSGEFGLDEHLTALVGTNEAGKTAILQALLCFNQDEKFKEADVSTLTVYPRLYKPGFQRSTVPMVTLSVRLESDELRALAIPAVETESLVRVTKSLDGEYTAAPEFALVPGIYFGGTQAGRSKTADTLETLLNRLADVYEGFVKFKPEYRNYAFLAKTQDEASTENVHLSEDYAGNIWPQINEGDWVQATKVVSEQKGLKALNAGIKVDLQPIRACLAELIRTLRSAPFVTEDCVVKLTAAVEKIPPEHPIGALFPSGFKELLSKLRNMARGTSLPDLLSFVLGKLPKLVYVADTTEIEDTLLVSELEAGTTTEPGHGSAVRALAALGRLEPSIFYDDVDSEARREMLSSAARSVSDQLARFWDGLAVEFEYEKGRLKAVVSMKGSTRPLPVRSAGLRSFFSLIPRIISLSSEGNCVLLLDDPCVHLHPRKQQEIARYLSEQAFPVVITTHSPYMIDPRTLNMVRLVKRVGKDGTRVDDAWSIGDEGLETIFGSLSTQLASSRILVVEGKDDWHVYTRLSDYCKSVGRPHLPQDLSTLIAGGASHAFWVVSALQRAGSRSLVLLDGDVRGGIKAQSKIREMPEIVAQSAVTLYDFLGEHLEVLDLFDETKGIKEKELKRNIVEAILKDVKFSEALLKRMDLIFGGINKAYAQVFSAASSGVTSGPVSPVRATG